MSKRRGLPSKNVLKEKRQKLVHGTETEESSSSFSESENEEEEECSKGYRFVKPQFVVEAFDQTPQNTFGDSARSIESSEQLVLPQNTFLHHAANIMKFELLVGCVSEQTEEENIARKPSVDEAVRLNTPTQNLVSKSEVGNWEQGHSPSTKLVRNDSEGAKSPNEAQESDNICSFQPPELCNSPSKNKSSNDAEEAESTASIEAKHEDSVIASMGCVNKDETDEPTGVGELHGISTEALFNKELEENLEFKAEQLNLTATNVKNILHEVITNEHVVALVKAAMLNEVSPLFEPKMTRSKVKDVVEKSLVHPPWSLYPLKCPSQTKVPQFVDIPLAEDDSSDEEYQPEEEEEEDLAKSPEEAATLMMLLSKQGIFKTLVDPVKTLRHLRSNGMPLVKYFS
uniref:GON-4-like protein n=1 Tax=Myxine glutinosa TaxID=7769 RepID=UPI003590180E